MISWPPDLVSDIARRRTVIFLGSGISRNSSTAAGQKPKTWEDFLRSAAADINPKRHIMKLIRDKDYLTACEIIKRSLGKDGFNAVLRNEFLVPRYTAAPIHESIFRLDSRIVATPNFDKIYETYANHKAQGSIIVKNHYDPDIAEALRGTDRVIVKVHGTIDSPDRMIFTRREYAEGRQRYREFYSLLEALALTNTFLFLGCGINDPDIRLLLEDVFFRHPSSRQHIFVLPSTGMHASVKSAIQESMNLSIILYKPANNHKELADSVTDLCARVETERDKLKETGNW